MYVYLFIKYFIIFCMILGICIRVVPIFVAAHNVRKEKKLAAHIAQLESEEPEEPPFYVMDKLDAFDAVIESNRKLLELLNAEYEKANTPAKRATIRKKQADIMVKLANIEEKAYKLREKNGL